MNPQLRIRPSPSWAPICQIVVVALAHGVCALAWPKAQPPPQWNLEHETRDHAKALAELVWEAQEPPQPQTPEADEQASEAHLAETQEPSQPPSEVQDYSVVEVEDHSVVAAEAWRGRKSECGLQTGTSNLHINLLLTILLDPIGLLKPFFGRY